MRPLPADLSIVTVPTHVSPSALGTAGGCALRLIAASRAATEIERLDVGPELSIGLFAHRVIEQFALTQGKTPAEVFDEIFQQFSVGLLNDPRRAHFADLSATKTRAEWFALKAWIVSRCERNQVAHSSSSGSGSRRQLGNEVPLDSVALRLRGSADRVSRLGHNEFEVRDFKSGTVVEEDGTIKEAIRLQLLAYGLMVAEQHPRSRVRLVVDDGSDHEIAFDHAAREIAKTEIHAITQMLPAPGPRSIEGLMVAGPGCWGCPVRHVCPTYKRVAPSWWIHYPRELKHVSRDAWGQVVAIKPDATSGRFDVVLSDAAARRIKVERVDPRHGISEAQMGERVWMFDLEAPGPGRDFNGNRLHPRGFCEHPRDRRERRAWRLQVYRDA